MEGDVAISHAMRVEALIGFTRDPVRIASVVRLPGKVPWGYDLLAGDETFTLSANVVLGVVYWHQTIESAGEMLLELAQNAAILLRGRRPTRDDAARLRPLPIATTLVRRLREGTTPYQPSDVHE